MDLDADMVRNETNDPLTISGGNCLARVSQTGCETISPKAAIRIEHHLDHRCIIEKKLDRWAQSRPQHARAPRGRLRLSDRGHH